MFDDSAAFHDSPSMPVMIYGYHEHIWSYFFKQMGNAPRKIDC